MVVSIGRASEIAQNRARPMRIRQVEPTGECEVSNTPPRGYVQPLRLGAVTATFREKSQRHGGFEAVDVHPECLAD
jgi:hypothetical protein